MKAAGLGRKQLGLPGRTGDLACGPGSVVLNQPTPKRERSRGDLKKKESEEVTVINLNLDPGSLEEKEELEAVNTKAWKNIELKEEESISKLVLPQPPRLVKRTRKRKVKLPELIEGQQEIKNFLKAAGGCQPKFPKKMLVPTPLKCEENIGTGSETRKRKMASDVDVDDELEPSPKRTASQLRRKPSSSSSFSSATELDISQLAKLSENNDHENIVCKIEKCVSKNSSPSHPVTPIMKTTESRSALGIASFSGHENIMGGNPKSAVKKNLETKFKNKSNNCFKMKLV